MTMLRTRFASMFATVALALGVEGCGGQDAVALDDRDVASAEGAWGHLALEPGAPHYLVNRRAGQSWRVCVPAYMTSMLPGVEAEIKAAVGIWAHYLDRNVDVRIETRQLPRAAAGQSISDLGRAYHAACGAGFDAVLGLAALDGATLGVTGGEGRKDASGRWTSFTRFLFLRDFTLSPDAIDTAQSSWVSFAQATGRPLEADALLTLMKERSFLRYVEQGRRLALPVLTHEIGHVWGMCDQYEGAGNCDPVNSSSHVVSDSIMGGASMRERGFLTDDDIIGIRTLARRPGFDAGWPLPSSTPPRAEVRPDVEYFRLDRIQRTTGRIALLMGIVVNRAMRLEIAYRASGTEDWRAFVPQAYEGRTDAPRLAMELPVDPASASRRLEIRVGLSLRGTSGDWAPIQTLTVSE
jgi:hypothetical protein